MSVLAKEDREYGYRGELMIRAALERAEARGRAERAIEQVLVAGERLLDLVVPPSP